MKDVIRTFNSTVIFSKFTLNIKIYKEFEGILSKVQTDFERNFVQVPLRLFWGEKSKQSATKITLYGTKYSSNKTMMSKMRLKKLRYFGGIHYLQLSFSIYSVYKNSRIKMVSRSLFLNKILQKHMGNRSKNTKKDTQIQNIRYLEA